MASASSERPRGHSARCERFTITAAVLFVGITFPEGNERYYSERYLLGAYLLNAGAATPKVLLPNAFIVHDLALVEGWRTFGNSMPTGRGMAVRIGGGPFWMQTGEESKRSRIA
jgi:hypothetical protein